MMNPKLAIVGQTPPPHNGQAKMIEAMLDALVSRGYDVCFVRMGFSGSVSKAGKFSFGKVFLLPGLVLKTLKALGVRRDRYLYYPPASPNLVPVLRDIVFLLMVRPFAKGLILQFHAGGVSRYAERHPVIRVFMRMVYGKMSLGIVQGASCPDDPGYFNARDKAIIPHGIDVPVYMDDAARSESAILKILYVGIHTEEKGIFTLLETARILKARGVAFRMRTVGKWYADQEERAFATLRKSYGLEDDVQCVGRKTGDGLWREYRDSDVLFFPTHYPWETMGIVQLEAMAHGIPVVASDWQGPRDVVVDGDTGYLCPPLDPAFFADRLAALAGDVELRRRMGESGLKRYRSMYTETQYISRIEDALQQLPT